MVTEGMALRQSTLIALNQGSSKELPVEFRIFKFGRNKTVQGDFFMDRKAAKMVMAAYRDHGVDMVIDWEHQALSNPPVEAPAAGWFSLELRETGIYAVNVRWTEKAKARLLAGEYRYFSPALRIEKRSDQKEYVSLLVNAALTNVPATKNQEALMAARAIPYGEYPLKEEGDWDAAAAEGRIRQWAGDDLEKYAKAFTWYDAENPEALGSYKLPHHDIANGELVTVRAGVIAAGNAVSGARGGVDIPESDLAGVQAHLAEHYAEFGMDAPWQREEVVAVEEECDDEEVYNEDTGECEMEMKALNTALGLKVDAKETEALSEAMSLRSVRSEIVKLTGCSEPEALVEHITRLKAKADQVDQLSAVVEELRKSVDVREREALLDAAVAEQKISVKDEETRAFALALPRPHFDGWMKTLRAPVKPAISQKKLSSSDVLGEEAKAFIRKFGVTPEEIQETNAARRAAGEE